MDRLLRSLMRSGFRRGVRGEGAAWLAVGVFAWLLTRARRPDTALIRTVLRPGERLLVSTAPAGAEPAGGAAPTGD